MAMTPLFSLLLQDAAPAADGANGTVKIVAGVLALVLVIIIVLRRKSAKKKSDEDEF
jgi:hypothetical protein